jgi:hypothetical protein
VTAALNFTPTFEDSGGFHFFGLQLIDEIGAKSSIYQIKLNVNNPQCKNKFCRVKFYVRKVTRQGLLEI